MLMNMREDVNNENIKSNKKKLEYSLNSDDDFLSYDSGSEIEEYDEGYFSEYTNEYLDEYSENYKGKYIKNYNIYSSPNLKNLFSGLLELKMKNKTKKYKLEPIVSTFFTQNKVLDIEKDEKKEKEENEIVNKVKIIDEKLDSLLTWIIKKEENKTEEEKNQFNTINKYSSDSESEDSDSDHEIFRLVSSNKKNKNVSNVKKNKNVSPSKIEDSKLNIKQLINDKKIFDKDSNKNEWKEIKNKNIENIKKERNKAFEILGDKEKIDNKLSNTKLCFSVLNNTNCPHKNCRFAHDINKIIIASCLFKDCRFVKKESNGKYCNISKTKTCKYKHDNETPQNYYLRIGMNNGSEIKKIK
jgi:hypothetical protein